MKYSNTINWVLRGLIAFLFVFSAISKLFPIGAFEKQIVDLGITNWCFAPILARAIISFELFLGISFLQNHFFKKFIIPMMVGLLVAFCFHLGWQIHLYGNTGNCGCMGQVIPMTPLQAITKNIISLIIIAIIYFKTPAKKDSLHRYPILILIPVTLFVFLYFHPACCCDTPVMTDNPIISMPAEIAITNTAINGVAIVPEAKTIEKSTIKKDSAAVKETKPKRPSAVSEFAPYKQFSDGKMVNLDEGKNIVCVFNTTCDHCMNAAKEIVEVTKTTKTPPIHILFWSEGNAQGDALAKEVSEFFKFAGASYPYKVIDMSTFFRLLGKAPSPPRVAVLDKGNIVAEFSSMDFTKEAFIKAFK